MKIITKQTYGQIIRDKFPVLSSAGSLIRILVLFTISGFLASCQQTTNKILLNGEWALHLAPEKPPHSADPQSLDYNLSIQLPGTLDDAGIGDPNPVEPNLEREVMLHLHRKVTYTGPAYYTREINIPKNWEDKNISLRLERILWESIVWVNGQKVGNNLSLSTAHEYDLTSFLNPGKNTLTICVDNSKKYDLNRYDLAHAYTNHTQIIWNGILGDIILQAKSDVFLSNIEVFPDFSGKKISGSFSVSQPVQMAENAVVKVLDKQKREVASVSVPVNGTSNSFNLTVDEEIVPWNDVTPELYDLEITLLSNSGEKLHSLSQSFGFRNLEARDGRFFINGNSIFLRGTLDCAVFPLTGYPHTDVEGWRKTFSSAKDFGLNHIRFHSWCPPKAAFEAADQMGMYLQIELPNWGLNYGEDMGTVDFLNNEADEIIKAYGNHPSFVLMSLGNELQGNFAMLNGLVNRLQNLDNRHLYTTTSFTFEEGHGLYPEPVDDFFITQYTEKGWVRGQGVFDQYPPRFNADYTHAMYHIEVPLITHEIGQYSIFPDLSEIEKYTGVLEPTNFVAVKNDLDEKGLLPMSEAYTEATGKFATLLYKEEIERALKTDGIDGFQLLDLHDFSGQGTALVGVLNAFWEPKGFVTGEQWRMFCSELVPLLWFDKAVYTSSETFNGEFGIANYSHDLINQSIVWELKDSTGQWIDGNTLDGYNIVSGETTKLGNITIDLSKLKTPAKYLIELSLPGTSYKNNWEIWLYEDNLVMPENQIVVTGRWVEALTALEQGKSVLFSGSTDKLNGIEGKFVPVFWSPVHFPDQPGTMGLLVDPKHEAFSHFPTDFYSNWQWWDLFKNSKTLDIDSLNVEPVVTVIDNFFKNRRLTNLFQAKVKEGKLMFSSIDLQNDLENRPVARQLKYSLINYMNSADFSPERDISEAQLNSLFAQ
jgi:hypothetical protein